MIFTGGNLTATTYFDLVNNRTSFVLQFGPLSKRIYFAQNHETLELVKNRVLNLFQSGEIPDTISKLLSTESTATTIPTTATTTTTTPSTNDISNVINGSTATYFILLLIFGLFVVLGIMKLLRFRSMNHRNSYEYSLNSISPSPMLPIHIPMDNRNNITLI